jgi:hypothetical protein
MLAEADEAAAFACLKHSARIALTSFPGAASAVEATTPSNGANKTKVLNNFALNIAYLPLVSVWSGAHFLDPSHKHNDDPSKRFPF